VLELLVTFLTLPSSVDRLASKELLYLDKEEVDKDLVISELAARFIVRAENLL